MHRKTGVAVAFWNDLDPARFKLFFRLEMFYLDPKTGKELDTSPIWNPWEIKEEEEYFFEGLQDLLEEYTQRLANPKPGTPLDIPLDDDEQDTGQTVWPKTKNRKIKIPYGPKDP